MLNKITRTLTDAQIKALPTTGITIHVAPGAGFRIKPVAISLVGKFTAGAYTNVNATYSDIHIEVGTEYIIFCVANDSSTTPAISQMTDFMGAVNRVVDPPITDIVSVPVAGGAGYILPNSETAAGVSTTVWDDVAISIKAENNGSGNFTGGNAANTLKVTFYFIKEEL